MVSLNSSLNSSWVLDLNQTEDYQDYLNGDWEGLCSGTQNQSLGLVLGPYVHSLICVLGLVGNGLMLLTLCCSPRPPSVTQVLLLHLGLADLVIVLVLPGLVVMDLGAGSGGRAGCKLLRGGYSLSLYGAALLLAAVSADRYAAVVHARRRLRAHSLELRRAVSAAVWLTAAALAIPNFIYYDWYVPQHELPDFNLYPGPHNQTLRPELNQSQDQDWDQTWGWIQDQLLPATFDPAPGPAPGPAFVCALRFNDSSTAVTLKKALPVLQFVAGFLVPLLVMCFCYGAIVHTLLKGRGLCGGGRSQGFRRERAVRLVLMVALVFILCHAPFNILLLWSTITQFHQQACQSWDRLKSALVLAQTVALLHCVLNPLLYGFSSAPFRTAFCSVLHKLRPQRRLSSTSQSERSTHYTL